MDQLNAVVAIEDGTTASPLTTNLEDKAAAATNLAHEVGKHGATAHPFVVGIDDGATAIPLGIKAGEEGCLAYPFESDKKDMDALAYPLESDTLPSLSENEEEEIVDSVNLLDGEAGVQEYDGYQLTAADTEENGNDEDEESSEATLLV